MKTFVDTHALKYIAGFAIVFVLRLLPFRLPNVEPVMATMMPFAKRFGMWGGFLFGSLSIVLFDAVTSGWGVWTLITALAYGALGAGAHYFFKHRESTARNYVVFAIFGTLFYDAVTGL
ncbi:MAG: ECF transporter S component, partial [Candidatus Pacebacteria bacterium]|nr:ECF transporter S component [Candidatus Paceibacterota bacterium]